VSKAGRRPEPRLAASRDRWVRDAVERAQAITSDTYVAIGNALGMGGRWCGNTLGRRGTLSKANAQLLMRWVLKATAGRTNDESRSSFEYVAAVVSEETPQQLTSVPMLVLDRDIDKVARAFDRYLEQRGRSGAKGLLREFLRRPTVVGKAGDRHPPATFARACAWDLASCVRMAIAKRYKTYEITESGRTLIVTPEDLQTIIYGLEGLVEPENLPRGTRKQIRKAHAPN
jgi:hypothetical protein